MAALKFSNSASIGGREVTPPFLNNGVFGKTIFHKKKLSMSDVLVDGKANVVGVVLGLFFGEHLLYCGKEINTFYI